MVRAIAIAISGGLCVAVAHAELSLLPKVLEREGEGGKYKELAFADGGKIATYQPPLGWDYFGKSTQLTLRPPNKSQAEATITRVPLSEPGTFDDEGLKKLVSDALAQVPKGSENVCVISQEKNPLMIQRKETFLLTLSYTFYGEKYTRSVLTLNRGSEQIRSQLTCREADFKDLHAAFLRSQYTWQHL